MNKIIIAAGALIIASTAAHAGSSGKKGYGHKELGNGYANSSKIIQDNSYQYGGKYGKVLFNPYAKGNDAYTAQLGKYNSNVTVQSGDANYQYLYQNGYKNSNQTWQFGYGNSHIGVQDGYKHTAVVAQKGLYNKGKTFQFGSNNDARIVQAGRTNFMKPHLRMKLTVEPRKTAAYFRKHIVKPGTFAIGGGKWAPRTHRPTK